MTEAKVRPTQQLVEELTAYLINSGAHKYIEDHYTITLDGGPEATAVITVQYTDKPSAHELRVKAEAECERLHPLADRVVKLETVVREFAGFFSSDDPRHWELLGLADDQDYGNVVGE